MNIICHRGYWNADRKQNSIESFQWAIKLSLGIETDIRDCNGKIVISHDVPFNNNLLLTEFLEMCPKSLFLALNVKADGLSQEVGKIIQSHNYKNYMFFDMSVPDMMGYISQNLNVAMRMSEYEPLIPSLERYSNSIWLDAFHYIWYDEIIIQNLQSKNYKIYIVSEELHGREYHSQWQFFKNLNNTENLTLCTDFPEEANQFFLA